LHFAFFISQSPFFIPASSHGRRRLTPDGLPLHHFPKVSGFAARHIADIWAHFFARTFAASGRNGGKKSIAQDLAMPMT